MAGKWGGESFPVTNLTSQKKKDGGEHRMMGIPLVFFTNRQVIYFSTGGCNAMISQPSFNRVHWSKRRRGSGIFNPDTMSAEFDLLVPGMNSIVS
jgi:hypothetical protein